MPVSTSRNPIRFKREIHFDSVESILFLDSDADAYYRSMPSYTPSRVFRYHPYSEFRQRYITVDADMRVVSDGSGNDFKVIFGTYNLHSPNKTTVPPPVAPAVPPPPGRFRRLTAWLWNHLFPNAP